MWLRNQSIERPGFSASMERSRMETSAFLFAVASSNAALTVLLAFILLKEDLALKEWAGIATVILGIVVLRS